MEKIFKIKGQQVVATLAGDPNNPPVFLIHGWGSQRGVWQQTIPVLQEKYYCIAVDLLGFGGSDKPGDVDYSIAMQGARIVFIADTLGFKNFSLIGHSMGGQIAMYIATMLAPDRVEKLASIGGVVTGQLSERVQKVVFPLVKLGRKWPWLYNISRSWVNFRPYVNWLFRPWFFDMNCMPLKTWEVDRLAILNPVGAIPLDESRKALSAVDLTKYLHKVKAKTVVVSGEDDGTVPKVQSELAADLIPNSNLALIKKCGHFPMYEKTKNYLKALAIVF